MNTTKTLPYEEWGTEDGIEDMDSMHDQLGRNAVVASLGNMAKLPDPAAGWLDWSRRSFSPGENTSTWTEADIAAYVAAYARAARRRAEEIADDADNACPSGARAE